MQIFVSSPDAALDPVMYNGEGKSIIVFLSHTKHPFKRNFRCNNCGTVLFQYIDAIEAIVDICQPRRKLSDEEYFVNKRNRDNFLLLLNEWSETRDLKLTTPEFFYNQAMDFLKNDISLVEEIPPTEVPLIMNYIKNVNVELFNQLNSNILKDYPSFEVQCKRCSLNYKVV